MNQFRKSGGLCLTSFSVILTTWSYTANAIPLEIIHTNDLHSYFKRGDDPDHGGYAAVKATMDRLKSRAAQQGIEALTLDAGDFSEGTPLYNATDGSDSWRMIQSMGYDAITIGNHDWLCGPKQMNQIIQEIQMSTPFLGANLKMKRFKSLREAIQPHLELTRAGLKIAIVGLTTRERIYRWRFKSGKIKSPVRIMRREVDELHDRNDLVIALSHLGLDADESLAKKVEGVDLIIGGHSHTMLSEPKRVVGRDGRSISIVQTGAHGQFVGDLLIDYEPGKEVKILRYELVPVLNRDGDATITQEIKAIESRFEVKYGVTWLNEILASKSTPMITPTEHATAWGNFYVDAVREAVDADVGLDSSEFFGINQESGPITRRSLLNFYPRYFDVNHQMGWNVWTLHVNGLVLETLVKLAVKNKTFLNFSHLTYEIDQTPTGVRASQIRVDGHPIRSLRSYRVAVTEGFGLGAKKIHWLANLILKPSDSGISVWKAVEDKLLKDGAPQSELPTLSKTTYGQNTPSQ